LLPPAGILGAATIATALRRAAPKRAAAPEPTDVPAASGQAA
jgi:hypothetical protein